MKLWMTARDERVCSDCAALDGQVVDDDAFFILPGGMAVAGPFHPLCRCRIMQFEMPPPPLEPQPDIPPAPPVFRWLDFGDTILPRVDPATITQQDRDALLATVKRLAAAAAYAATLTLDERRSRLELRPIKPDLTDETRLGVLSPVEALKRGLRR